MSEAQFIANRANSLRSTGPVSPAGKATVARNAVRHGLLARQPVLSGEDLGAFHELRDGIQASLRPSGGLEQALVDRVVSIVWRLQRLTIIEAGILTSFTAGVLESRAEAALRPRLGQDASIRKLLSDRFAKTVTKPALTFSPVDSTEREDATRELAIARAEKRRPEVALAAGFMRAVAETDYLGLLARYETTLSRDLDRTLDRLARLQELRGFTAGSASAATQVASDPDPVPAAR